MECLLSVSSCPLSSPKLMYGSSSPSISCRRSFPAVSCRATTQTATCGVSSSNSNFYKVLSLSPKSATADDIKRAYRSMALRYHPDVCHDPSLKEQSTKMFVALNEAYKTLSNPSLRREYDDCVMGSRSSKEESRRRWQEQIAELKRRAGSGMARKRGSWGSRMRAKNKERS